MFWDSSSDYDRDFSVQVRELVNRGDRAGIKRLYSHFGALEMLNSESPGDTRVRMRERLRDALLERNRKAKRGYFTDLLIV